MPKPTSIWKGFLLLVSIAIVGPASGQFRADHADDKTLIQLDAASIQVVGNAQLSLDSAMKLVSLYRGVSPISVIAEGMDDTFSKKYSGWMNSGHVDSILRLLPGFDSAGRTEARLLIGAWYAFQPGAYNYRKAIGFLQEAQAGAKSIGRIDWVAQCYCLLSKAYYMLTDTVNGNKWYFSLMRDTAFSAMQSVLAKAGSYAGMYYTFSPQTNRFRLDCLKAALKRFQSLNDTGDQVNMFMDIAYMSFAAGDTGASKASAQRSLRLQQAWHFPNTQYTYDLLAFLDINNGDRASALSLDLLGLDAATATDDRHFVPVIENRIGICYVQLSNKETAFQWFQKAMQAEIAIGGDPTLYVTLQVLGSHSAAIPGGSGMINTIRNTLIRYPPTNVTELTDAYLSLGEGYRAQGNYPEAKHYYQLAWRLEPEVVKIRGGMKNAVLIHRMGLIDMLTGHYREARKYLSILVSKPYSTNVEHVTLLDAYNDLYTVDSILGDYRSALHYLSNYEYLLNKIDAEKQNDQLLDLNVKYQTLQREKRLQELQTENRLQLQKDATARKLYYGGFALLGFVLLMLYARYYSNKRKNRQLNAQKQEIDQQNLELQQLNWEQTLLIEEKEWLLREIHHRVKNNLHMITSLLLSQSEFLRDQAAIDIMKESQRRVETMSLIHQKLYNSGNLSSIYMPEYIGELVEYLKESFVLRHKIVFSLDIEKIWLDVSKAVPLGLILNEVITNAFKYAFPHTREDRVFIRLMTVGDMISLEVKDNGRGLPRDFDLTTGSSFGMILMRGMAEDLQGIFEVDGTDGTCISIRFNNQASARK